MKGMKRAGAGALAAADAEQGSFLPNFCSITSVFAVVLGGQLLAFVVVLAGGWPRGRLWEVISLTSLYVQWIALGSAAMLCLARRWLGGMPAVGVGLLAWAGIMLISGAAAGVVHLLADQAGGLVFDAVRHPWELLLRSLGVSGIVGALVLRYLYLHAQWREQLVARSEARFQALQARIRPHFLFNSMNTIANLTRSDPRRAEAVIEDLSDLFRAALSDPAGGSTLGHELELVRRYLDVEAQRLGGRLRVDWDLEPLPEQARLPLLVLQPLVENAVYHGVEPSREAGRVCIAGRYREGRVNLSVRNSMPVSPGAHARRRGNRMALENVQQRLEAMYPGNSRLTLGRVDNEYQVRLVFPFP
jgi:two-component system sensor histidine kinase AlgZ